MKIFLVVPDSVNLFDVHPARTLRKAANQVPLGLLYVAAAVEKAGHEIVIIDNYLEEMSLNDLVNRIVSERPDCVGFSATILNIWQGLSAAKLIKAELPSCLIVFGGPQATIDPYGTVDKPGVDCVIRGEGEWVFTQLLEAYAGNKETIAELPGILFKQPNGKVIESNLPKELHKLSELPSPARHLIDIKRYERVGAGLLMVPVDILATSRGCSFRCAFCSSAEYWNRKYRTRPPEDVVDEMEFMAGEYGTKGFYFREDNFTLNKKHVLGICNEIKRRGLNFIWECESRVDTLNREVMARMIEAGCRFIWCGVESGSQRILDFLCKGITVEQIRNFYSTAHELGFRTGAGFMIGVPGETEEDIQKSVQLAKEIDADYTGFLSYIAFPGSPLYKKVRKEELFSLTWESICFVESEHLSRKRILELEIELNRKFRLRTALRHPLHSFSSAIQARMNRKLHSTARSLVSLAHKTFGRVVPE